MPGPNELRLRTKTRTFTTEQLQNYWFQPHVRESIMKQCDGRHVMFHCVHSPDDTGPHLKRHLTTNELSWLIHHDHEAPEFEDGKPFIQLHRDEGNTQDPHDLSYFITRGLVEVVPEVHPYTDLTKATYLVIEPDSKGAITHEQVRDVTKEMWDLLGNAIPHSYAEIRFTGGRSFHLCYWLPLPRDFAELRETAREALAPLEGTLCSLKNTRERTNFIYLDCGACARHRAVRALGSLHFKMGRCCVRVGTDAAKLDVFQPAMSEVRFVEKYPQLVEYREKYPSK